MDIITIKETEESVRQMTQKLIYNGKDIRLQVNERNTKYLIISRKEHLQGSLVVDGLGHFGVSHFGVMLVKRHTISV